MLFPYRHPSVAITELLNWMPLSPDSPLTKSAHWWEQYYRINKSR